MRDDRIRTVGGEQPSELAPSADDTEGAADPDLAEPLARNATCLKFAVQPSLEEGGKPRLQLGKRPTFGSAGGDDALDASVQIARGEMEDSQVATTTST